MCCQLSSDASDFIIASGNHGVWQLTPNIPSHTYSLLYLKHEVHFANPGISYGCNKLKPRRAEEKAAPKPGFLGGFSRITWLWADPVAPAGQVCSATASPRLVWVPGSQNTHPAHPSLEKIRGKENRKIKKEDSEQPLCLLTPSHTLGWGSDLAQHQFSFKILMINILVCFSLGPDP